MAETDLGVEVPAGSDVFDPQGDMVALANSLRSRIVVPVPDVAGRTALLAAIDWTPSADEPLRVCRADAPAGARDEITYDNGATWLTYWAESSRAWIAPSLGNSWGNYGGGQQVAQYRKDAAGDVEIRGQVAGGTTAGPMFTLPDGYRPGSTQIFGGIAGPGLALMAVLTSGAVQVLGYQNSGTNANVTITCRFSIL